MCLWDRRQWYKGLRTEYGNHIAAEGVCVIAHQPWYWMPGSKQSSSRSLETQYSTVGQNHVMQSPLCAEVSDSTCHLLTTVLKNMMMITWTPTIIMLRSQHTEPEECLKHSTKINCWMKKLLMVGSSAWGHELSAYYRPFVWEKSLNQNLKFGFYWVDLTFTS